MRGTIIIWTFGLFLPLISAQILTTKCPTYWTKYKERCYLIPGYRHSWHRAKSYCEKYGAKLVQPTGYEINNKISQDVADALTDAESFWTGYHRPDNTQPAYSAQWSDGQPTSVEVGVWGQSEPNTAVGQYAWVSTQDSKWYMGDSNTVRNFVCEMDPCPSGTRDTYMCNGKCLSTSTVCNGVNDCGNNQDENNCATVLGRDCTTEYEGTSGTITMSSTSTGQYQPNMACSWTVKTSPDKRIVLEFVDFETELNTDYVELWDGGLTRSTSQLAARLSGPLDEYTFTSSYNFVTIKFVSDSSTQYPAGHIKWKTDADCGYDNMEGYGYSNSDIEFDTTKLPSIKTTQACKDECDETPACYGFRYKASERTCYFINKLPVLQMDSSSELWIKKCYGETTVQAGVPLFPVELSATTTPKQLATPFHPNPYVAMELEYTIKAPANNLITLEVLYLNLCCGDNIYIYDKDRDLLETLDSDSTPTTIISTGNTVHLKMDLFEHWKCNGALIQYKQGCDVRIVGSGTLSSPGYGTSKSYPDLMECSWTLYAPSEDRSVTVVFEDFDLEQDVMMVVPSSGPAESYTGTSLNGQARTEENMVTLTMSTGSRYSGRGFKASFSPGCPVLDALGYVASPQRFDFGDHVNLSCAEGFMFSGDYSQQTYVALTCESGGHWSIPNVPSCSQGNCGPAPFVANGYIESSGGSVGGSIARYRCNTNYTLEGSSSITCLADNNWEQPPTCVSNLCGSISTLAPTTDPEVLFLDGELHGSVVKLSCDDVNKEIIGAETVQCISGEFDFASDTDPSFCRPIPCEKPIIENAVLTPEPAAGYILGQEITVACVEGYVMNGVANFTCGSNISFPKCLIRNCSLTDFDHVIPSDGSVQSVYRYADDVNVTCEAGFYLEGISTTDMTVTCMHTGKWSHNLTCGMLSCGEPYAVPGSFYVPDTNSDGFCYEHGCSFTFQCRNKYQRLGNSSIGNHTVTCGMVYDGLWDLGDLRCIGGQCPDPGYPASGKLIGDSFEEGARVNFSCTQLGYEPLISSGQVSQGMLCHYNETSDMMEWIGEMPECKDTQAPIISNCDGGMVTYRTDTLMPLIGALDPRATDNNNIQRVLHYPENIYLSQPFDDAKTITWFFYDFDGNSNGCIVNVLIPASIDCMNDASTQLILYSDSYFSVADFVEQKNGAARVVYEPEGFQVDANFTALNTIYEAEVTSFNGDTDEILDMCTVQLRFRAPVCATWAFEVPNGVKDCSGETCNITCNAGSYFMEDPALTFILMHCNASGWDREPPVCAEGFENYLIFTAKYDFKYYIADGVTDSTTCIAAYRPIIQENLKAFAAAMEGPCNEGVNNEVSISLREEKTYLEYNLGTKREFESPFYLTVNFEFLINVLDDTLSGATATKEKCANGVIQSKLNIKQDIGTISSLSSPATGCGSGTYDLPTTQTQYGYDCEGYRRLQPYTRECLNCPLGYYYNEFNCVKCPEGTYGQQSANGSMCQTCPDSRNPGLIGQTHISSCDFKEACPEGYFSFDGFKPCEPCPIGYYSTEAYSRTCASCISDEVTYNTASTSIIDCKTLTEAVSDNAVTPCTPDNPCRNGGTCGFVRHDYNCTCPPGYTGRTCESRFDLCTSNPCKNDKECVTTPGSDTFSCICSANPSADSELSGDLCEIDTFGCAESFCRNNGTCHNQFQSHSCKCPTYSGYRNEDIRGTGSGTCGTVIDPCEVEPKCQHGTCIPNGNYYKTCDCEAGWTGIYCENDIDDCDPSYCENGATCEDGVNSFMCACADGFFGPYCQFRLSCDRKCVDQDDEYCNTCIDDNTEECISVNNNFMCVCLEGFAGRSCEVETSLCKSFPCQHGGTCTAINATSFSCECMHPWTGDHCENQINYCPNGDECFNGGTCYSTSSGYRCRCPENFIGDNCSVAYNLCERANPCAAPKSNCSFSEGVFQCSCPTGYKGVYCEDKLSSCSDNFCQNGGTCTEDASGAVCTCPEEFNGTNCDMEIDTCSSNPCPTNQDCVNIGGKYTCTCAAGFRGEDCDKPVGEDFDYVITPMELCREEASRAVFGDGETDIVAFTISFWARYTALHGSGVILNVFGSKSGGNFIPATPDFRLTFYSTRVDAEFIDTSASRRKREVESLVYPSSIADGYWHHLVVTWLATSGELTLYIDGQITDQIIFSENSPVANMNRISSGFLVFSEFDPYIGTTVPEDSFEGRISRITVVNTELPLNNIQQLYTRSPVTAGMLLHPERTTMQMYPIDYNSELNINRNKCTLDDNTCKRLDEAADIPEVVSCPTDTFVVTDREVSPNWTVPIFSGSTSDISNYPSGGTGFDYGVFGISYAGFDSQGDANTCTFRLFYYDVGCGDDDWNNAACDDISRGGKRCQGDCSTNQLLTGSLPRYQTCSMYGMWDEAVTYASYIFPECSDASDVTQKVTLELSANLSNGTCTEELKERYSSAVLDKFNQLNAQQTNSALCPSSCVNLLVPAFLCNGNRIQVSINFGILSSTMMYNGESVTTEDLLKIAVGDFKAFSYIGVSSTDISPDLSTYNVTVTQECAAGYMVSSGKCVLCGKGTSYDASTKTCKRCPVGSYRNVLTSVVSACTTCPSSLTTPTDGATDASYCITRCLTGQFFRLPANPNIPANAGTCTSCQVGYYQDETTGALSCKPCPYGLTTAAPGSTAFSDCVTPESLTTTTTTTSATEPDVVAVTEGGGLSVGAIVAVVLSIVIVLALIILIVCFCCCKELLPCLSKKKQVVSPIQKDGYYAKKYGDVNMHFVSYNLQDVREKKGKPLDRIPFVEPPMSDETGSVRTDISVHVPVFIEKMDGKVKRKSIYMSNGGQSLSSSLPRSGRTPRDPVMTSSPRETQYRHEIEGDAYVQPKQKRRRKHRKDRSTSEKRSRRRYEEGDLEPVDQHAGISLPRALAPMPQRLVSKPPDDVILRASSPLEQPRVQVVPSQYEDFIAHSPTRGHRSNRSPRSSRSRDKERSRSRHRPRNDDAELEPRLQHSREYYEEEESFRIKRIEVESDDDLR